MRFASLSITEEARMLRRLFVGRRGHTLLVGWRRELGRGLAEVAVFGGEAAMDALAEIVGAETSGSVH